MNKERLLTLADFLETIPEDLKEFNMRDWTLYPDKHETLKFDGTFKCGFAGCAIGWAAFAKIIPGLALNPEGNPYYRTGEGYFDEGWYAIGTAFDIPYHQAKWFFEQANYTEKATPGVVAKRIRQYVEGFERLPVGEKV